MSPKEFLPRRPAEEFFAHEEFLPGPKSVCPARPKSFVPPARRVSAQGAFAQPARPKSFCFEEFLAWKSFFPEEFLPLKMFVPLEFYQGRAKLFRRAGQKTLRDGQKLFDKKTLRGTDSHDPLFAPARRAIVTSAMVVAPHAAGSARTPRYASVGVAIAVEAAGSPDYGSDDDFIPPPVRKRRRRTSIVDLTGDSDDEIIWLSSDSDEENEEPSQQRRKVDQGTDLKAASEQTTPTPTSVLAPRVFGDHGALECSDADEDEEELACDEPTEPWDGESPWQLSDAVDFQLGAFVVSSTDADQSPDALERNLATYTELVMRNTADKRARSAVGAILKAVRDAEESSADLDKCPLVPEAALTEGSIIAAFARALETSDELPSSDAFERGADELWAHEDGPLCALQMAVLETPQFFKVADNHMFDEEDGAFTVN